MNDHEHDHEPGFQPTRRSFLKLAGFSTGGALLAGCTGGLETKAIPYLVKPEEITPGRSEWYATLCSGCDAGCGVLAKCRDGRPIKIEGNPEHPLSRGGVCAVGQAQILSLYDARRLDGPREGGQPIEWADADRRVRDRLTVIADAGGAIRLLTARTNGPTDQREIRRFLDAYPTARHVAWTPLSTGAIAKAYETVTGVAPIVPRYRFENADTIVSFDADFLGSWLSPVEHTRGWSEGRARADAFSYHVQFESRLSLTGSKADRRIVVAPTDATAVLVAVADRVLRARGVEAPWSAVPKCAVADAALDDVARRLTGTSSGRALVVSGSSDPFDQGVVAVLNEALGSTDDGGTVDLHRASNQAKADDAAFAELRREIQAGEVDALIVARVNPVYDHADGSALAKSLGGIDLVVSLADRVDETAEHAHFVLPEPHALATWTDAEPVDGLLTLGQPAIRPLGDCRSLAATLAAWRGDARPIDALVREAWREDVLPRRRGGGMGFGAFWDRAVHDGFVEVEPGPGTFGARAANLGAIPTTSKPADGMLTLVGYAKVGLRDGSGAENPWLQELPDPISKTAWDNYGCLAPETASKLGVIEGDLVWVELDEDLVLRLPILVQPGQHRDTIAVAIGYGRKGTARFADVAPDWIEGRPTLGMNGRVGVDVRPLLTSAFPAVRVTKAKGNRPLARTQQWHSLDVPDIVAEEERRRPCVQETTVSDWEVHSEHHGPPPSQTLWSDDHEYNGRHWNLVVDLTRCTGCAACVVSCQVENNIPVVGYDEVRRMRIMHWLRIDRYYTGEGDDVEIAQQPMLCQHCDDAPCETVCPVLATVHGSEGLNQQVYNRCVGTRYCSNNCPYKVRRFNWFDYRRDDPVENMALNPDVVVRSRGVMEKCSFCVQRIAEAKAEAKREGRELVDGDVMPACVQSCPSSALTFGDGNDPESAVAKAHEDPRHYRVLEELGVRPSVGYLALVRNDGKGEGR